MTEFLLRDKKGAIDPRSMARTFMESMANYDRLAMSDTEYASTVEALDDLICEVRNAAFNEGFDDGREYKKPQTRDEITRAWRKAKMPGRLYWRHNNQHWRDWDSKARTWYYTIDAIRDEIEQVGE